MSTSSLGSLSTAKKTPKRSVKPEVIGPAKVDVQAQLDSVRLELETLKMSMAAVDEPSQSKDIWMEKIDCDKLIGTIDSLSNGLSSKLDVIRQLSSVPKEEPSLVLNDEALKSGAERLEKVIRIMENLRS